MLPEPASHEKVTVAAESEGRDSKATATATRPQEGDSAQHEQPAAAAGSDDEFEEF